MVENSRFVNEDNEKALLNLILSNEDILLEAIENLDAQSFGHPLSKQVYNSILDLFGQGRPIIRENIVSILDDKPREYYLNLINENYDSSNYQEYLKNVRNTDLLRKCNLLALDIKNKLNTKRNGQELLSEIQNQIDEYSRGSVGSTIKFGDSIYDIIPDPDNYTPEMKKPIDGVVSGLQPLDNEIVAFAKGTVTIIGGRPSSCKSLLTRHILLHNAYEKDIPILLFSMDEMSTMVQRKAISTISDVNYNSLIRFEFTKKELNRIKEVLPRIKEMPFLIDNTPSLTPLIVRSKIKKALYRYPNLGVVAIDYIQLMKDVGKDRNEMIGNVITSLKGISMEFNIPIIIISQLSRAIENRENPTNNGEGEKWTDPPKMSDLRDSGELENSADKLLIIKAEPDKDEKDMFKPTRRLRVWIVKQRDGPKGLVNLIAIPKIQKVITTETETLPF
jgi:replicative DNA helicase